MKLDDLALARISIHGFIKQTIAGGVDQTDPLTGSLLADTGQLDAGLYNWYYRIWGTDNYNGCEVQHRNAANSANVMRLKQGAPIRSIRGSWFDGYWIANNERLRVQVTEDMIGVFGATIIAIRRF